MHFNAFIVIPNHGVADPRAQDVRGQGFQTGQRIFHRPGGVAGIERRADVFLAGGFDQGHQFPRLHVARVVFDRDLYPGVHRLAAAGLADFNGVGHARLDATFRFAIVAHAENAAQNRRAEGFGDANSQSQVLLG